jgi:pSer/pThr/pTyr-binding forkhead associated (FHA) protein
MKPAVLWDGSKGYSNRFLTRIPTGKFKKADFQMPKISLIFKNSVLADYHLPAGCSLKIGRKTDNDVVIENLAVSGHHAKIDAVGDGFIFIDLKSRNGSFVNKELVTSHWLHDGDTINIGKHALEFSYFDSEKQPKDEPSKLDKTMVIDTNEYRAMIESGEPKPVADTEPVANVPIESKKKTESAAEVPVETKKKTEPVAEVPAETKKKTESAAEVPAETKKKRVRGYITYIIGGEGALALKNKLTKIGKDPSSDIVVKGWAVGKTAATISRTRNGYFFTCNEGFSRPKINDRKAPKKPFKLVDSDIISIGSMKLQFINKKPKKNAAD